MDDTVKYRLGYVWMICLVAALGGLLFGYDWVVIGGAKPFFVSFFDLQSSWSKSWATSLRLGRLPVRGAGVWGAQRAVRAEEAADRGGRDLRGFLGWHGGGGTLPGLHRLAHLRRPGHWPGIQPFADVYRGNRPGPHAGEAGGRQPVHHRHRHPPGAKRQLAHCPKHAGGDARLVECPDGLAVDVRRDGDSLAVFPGGNVFCSREPALARQERQL